jgi:hypothetical protein
MFRTTNDMLELMLGGSNSNGKFSSEGNSERKNILMKE